LAFLWTRIRRPAKQLLAGLALLSTFISLVCVSVDITAPEYERDPLIDYLLPSFMGGSSRALLAQAGVPSSLSNILLIVLWAAVGAAMRQTLKHRSDRDVGRRTMRLPADDPLS